MELLAPAKINLYLKVVGRRADGYHELITLMCAVGFGDRIELRFGTGQTGITCSSADLPCDETNLAFQAVLQYHHALRCKTRLSPDTVAIRLNKYIPVGAGLGGGSSDAAAVFKGLNAHYGNPLAKTHLLSLALALGADVPFFIDAVPAVARGIGEKLEPFPMLRRMPVVIVFPGFGISTAAVFGNLNLRLTKDEKENRNFPFKNGDFLIPDHLCNDLEGVVVRQYPIIATIKEKLLAQGATGALMTGSGSAVFGLFVDMRRARQAGEVLMHDYGDQVFVTETLC